MYRAMFQVELSLRNSDKATAILQEGIKATDRNPNLLWLMANMLIDTRKLDKARQIRDEMQKGVFRKPLIDYLDARIEFVQQHWKTALDRLSDARASMTLDPNYAGYVAQIDFWMSRCHQQLGDYEQQEQDLRRVLAVNPSYAPAQKALADLSRRKGNLGDTLKGLQDMEMHHTLDPAGRVQLAHLLFLAIARQKPAQRNWKPLEKLLDALEKSLPDSPVVPALRADVLQAQGKSAAAEKLLLKTRDKYPKQLASWRGLVAMAIRGKDWNKAERLLAEAEKAMGDTVELRVLRSRCAVVRGGTDVDNRLQQLVENDERFSDEDRLRLWAGLLRAPTLSATTS